MDSLRVWAWRPPSAEAEAGTEAGTEAEAEVWAGEVVPAGPLAGFVLAVKDVIDVAGMPTRAGSPLTEADPARADAPAIARLRDAGATIAGKTQCTEWALNDPAPTVNPWDAGRTPGGSSAGSAVAVAAGLCTASVDTQTAGDIVRPAAYNGVAGLKPTFGWAPTEGGRAVAPSIDTLGVIARRVADAAAVAEAMADHPARFAVRAGAPRIGVLRDPFCDDVGPAVRAGLADTAYRFAEAGADVADVSSPVDLAAVHAAHRVITFAECALQHSRLYREHADAYGPRARELIERGLAMRAHAYLDACRIRQDAVERLTRLLNGVDALLVPATPEPAPPRLTTGDPRLQIPWTLCGFPTLTLPCGVSDGLPLAVQLVGAKNTEAALLAAGQWCERALDFSTPPLDFSTPPLSPR